MAEGIIKRLVSERGFGFIKPTEGSDLFFHSNQVRGTTFQALSEGLRVEFEIGKGPKGPMAVEIRLLADGVKKRPEDGVKPRPQEGFKPRLEMRPRPEERVRPRLESGGKEIDATAAVKDHTRAKRRALRSRDKRDADWD
jgi:cold shock protein